MFDTCFCGLCWLDLCSRDTLLLAANEGDVLIYIIRPNKNITKKKLREKLVREAAVREDEAIIPLPLLPDDLETLSEAYSPNQSDVQVPS